jgi:hypothetical protein
LGKRGNNHFGTGAQLFSSARAKFLRRTRALLIEPREKMNRRLRNRAGARLDAHTRLSGRV